MKEEPADGDFHRDAFAYPYLNSILKKTLSANSSVPTRPNYAWGVLHSAQLAKVLGISRISVVEFGVAGGVGLIALERIAERVERQLDVRIDVFGFDTGVGLPKPVDNRDCPNLYSEGTYRMDVEALRARLQRAHLILGLVKDTLPRYICGNPAPIGFVAFDLDLYSSTMDAFTLLDANTDLLLPRIHCYFDDILGFTFGDFNGERLAISDFNLAHHSRKISKLYGLQFYVPAEHARDSWVEKFYMAHIFDHPAYGVRDGLVRHSVIDLESTLSHRTR